MKEIRLRDGYNAITVDGRSSDGGVVASLRVSYGTSVVPLSEDNVVELIETLAGILEKVVTLEDQPKAKAPLLPEGVQHGDILYDQDGHVFQADRFFSSLQLWCLTPVTSDDPELNSRPLHSRVSWAPPEFWVETEGHRGPFVLARTINGTLLRER